MVMSYKGKKGFQGSTGRSRSEGRNGVQRPFVTKRKVVMSKQKGFDSTFN